MSPSSDTGQRKDKQTSGAGERVDGVSPSPEEYRSTEQQDLPNDVVFDLLSAKRRRRVLEFMAEHGTETTLSDLADHIAAEVNEIEIRMLNSQQRKRVYVALYQGHLPRMDDANVIEFENAPGTVELGPNATQLYQWMEVNPGVSNENDLEEGKSSGPVTTARLKIKEWVSEPA